MRDYEQEIKKLSPEHKRELWGKVKDLNFSNETKYRKIQANHYRYSESNN